ncbi:glycosyltransferase family 2 protein [Geomonas sp. RF6]|uniref:glycosyltransferase family 2 protein n=1 Tax=Geomonas sp. RF6 TaxID=2897342 RepID=UPI001E3E02AA|nr:glycosyltransferase family 2 protein [Geomonas sp. RF6]UFS71051.1 glycosyltransferase family 2 protein [Geomonas sp. RF6]
MSRILALIPAFNEGARIAGVIDTVRRAAPYCDILVVDDGSRDDTAAAARGTGATVVSHPFNMGYGVAIQTGYKYAAQHGFEFLVQIDGDGQHDPSYIPKLLEPVMERRSNFALGSRFLSSGSYEPSLARRIGMACFRRIVSFVTGTKITDSTSGYQAFDREVIKFFTGDIFPCDYPDADMLITLHRAGFTIAEVPVRMYANSEGKSMHNGLKPFYYVFKMFLSIAVTLLRSRKFYHR